MRNIIAIIIIVISLLGFSFLSNLLNNRIENENENGRWIMEMAIYPSGGQSGFDYLIQIDKNNVIRTRFGARTQITVRTIDESFFSKVYEEEERKLNEEELQRVLSLAKKLEATDGIMELEIALGSWEVVLKYRGVMYGMDYGASHFEPLRNLATEIMKLSPIEVELHGWS